MNAQRKTRNRTTKPTRQGVCPLCERAFLRAELVSANRKEASGTRRTIVTAIRQKFPSWTQEAGACRECWESFRGVARVRNFMKKFKFPRA
jgi:hypothetical protein